MGIRYTQSLNVQHFNNRRFHHFVSIWMMILLLFFAKMYLMHEKNENQHKQIYQNISKFYIFYFYVKNLFVFNSSAVLYIGY